MPNNLTCVSRFSLKLLSDDEPSFTGDSLWVYRIKYSLYVVGSRRHWMHSMCQEEYYFGWFFFPSEHIDGCFSLLQFLGFVSCHDYSCLILVLFAPLFHTLFIKCIQKLFIVLLFEKKEKPRRGWRGFFFWVGGGQRGKELGEIEIEGEERNWR